MLGYAFNAVYLVLLVVVSPWLIFSAIRKGKYREGFAEKFLGRVPRREGDARCVWLHAVSVGEVKLLEPLLTEIAQQHPDWQCVISTTTRTGHALAKKQFQDHLLFYCPLDFTWSVRAAMRRIRPDLLLLAELELWPNLVHLARRQGAAVAVVNGRLSEKSFRGYRRIRGLMSWLLRKIDLIATQNQQYADRFLQLGAHEHTVQVTGSIKFDGCASDRENPRTTALRQLATISKDDVVLVAGSTQREEEVAALATFEQLRTSYPHLRLVLVPRHPERFNEVAQRLEELGLPWQRRSLLNARQLYAQQEDSKILLVDTVGELGDWWGLADMALVGGSLGSRGGQNMIEPAAFGAAVCFGPNTQNFRDAVALLLAEDAATVIHDDKQLTAFAQRCLDEPEQARAMGERAANVVRQGRGATQRTVQLLSEVMPGARNSRSFPRDAA